MSGFLPNGQSRLALCAVALGLGAALLVLSWAPSDKHGTSLLSATAVKPTLIPIGTTGRHQGYRIRQQNTPLTVSSLSATAEEVNYADMPAGASAHPNRFGTIIGAFLAALGVIGLMTAAPPAMAFENAAPEAAQYRNNQKSPGKQPGDLGLLPRASIGKQVGLKECGGAPNCFSTSGPDAKHLVDPWLPPAGESGEEALAQLKSVVERYPPYQQQIDGGGFKIITSDPGYLYVQFESLQNGFIDDVEFAVNPNGQGILLRSSSRQGYLDISVNAKRLNWISAELRKLGWTAPELTRATHLDYFKQNNLEFFPWQK